MLTRCSYDNEKEIGAGIKEFLSKNPSIKREDIFVTTKVWPHLMEPADVEWSLNHSLTELGLDYIDCFLLHWQVEAIGRPLLFYIDLAYLGFRH